MKIVLASCAGLPAWEVDDRPLHAALERRGVELVVAPWDAPDLPLDQADACLLRTTWDYSQRPEAFLAWVRRAGERTLLLNPPALVAWNLNKRYLRALAERGVPHAPTLWIDRSLAPQERPELGAILAEWGVTEAFLKPIVGACARGTLRFGADAAGLSRAAAHLGSPEGAAGWMLQPFLPAVAAGERSAVLIEGVLSHSVVKVPVPGDYRVQDDHGASDAPVKLRGDELELARLAMAALSAIVDEDEALGAALGGQPPLYARVDMLRDAEDRAVLVELELIEPSLFFRHGPGAAERLAEALLARAESARGRSQGVGS